MKIQNKKSRKVMSPWRNNRRTMRNRRKSKLMRIRAITISSRQLLHTVRRTRPGSFEKKRSSLVQRMILLSKTTHKMNLESAPHPKRSPRKEGQMLNKMQALMPMLPLKRGTPQKTNSILKATLWSTIRPQWLACTTSSCCIVKLIQIRA